MVCRPCQADGLQSDKVYTRNMKGEGRSFKERQREQVSCLEYGKELARGSLVMHLQNQNGVAKRGLGSD